MGIEFKKYKSNNGDRENIKLTLYNSDNKDEIYAWADISLEDYKKSEDTYLENGVFNNWKKSKDIIPKQDYKNIFIMGISSYQRKKGYGKLLVSKIEEYAKENGYDYITLGSLNEAVGFWDKLGYTLYSDGRYKNMIKYVNTI
jgi:hypothetical protein